MQANELIEKINNIRIWKRGGERAPHKPLVLLYSLGRLTRGEPRLAFYEEIEEDLIELLMEFGPYRKTYKPNFPFVKLCNDGGIWELEESLQIEPKLEISGKNLKEMKVSGGFSQAAYNLLENDKELVVKIARNILEQTFNETLHQDILALVGLDLEAYSSVTANEKSKTRDPEFRDRILRVYEYRCAVCGFSVRLGNTLVGLEAAHIKWHCYGGPDNEENGLALCSMHHKLFDRGVFTINNEHMFRVAERAHGDIGFDEWLMRFNGKVIQKPQNPIYLPNEKYLDWHVKEVFRGPFKYVAV